MSETGGDGPSRRVLDELRRRILTGDLGEGDRLPSVRRLAAEFDVSPATAGRVLEQLQGHGLVVSHHGSGTYVRTFRPIRRSSPRRLSREGWGVGLAIQEAETDGRWAAVNVDIGEALPPMWAAEPLQVGGGQQAVFRARQFEVDGRSVQLATSWLPVDLARGTPIMHSDTGPGGIYARLADAGHAPTLFTEYLRTRMPLPGEVERLSLPDGTPVLEITRHAFEAGGRCVEVNRMILDGSAYLLDYTFPADVAGPAEPGPAEGE